MLCFMYGDSCIVFNVLAQSYARILKKARKKGGFSCMLDGFQLFLQYNVRGMSPGLNRLTPTMKGNYKLTWRERTGYCTGELALNLIYQTVSIWLMFYYTNVYGLDPGTAALLFLVVRIVDVIWDPFVGTFVDRAFPRWGKYRSWLWMGGIPLSLSAILCFWNGFGDSLVYACVTYVALSMCFTLTSVPYGALGDSLTRDTHELTVLTSVRMIFANIAGMMIKTLPLIIALFAPKVLNPETGEMVAVYNTPEADRAWFITMSLFVLSGLVLLFYSFSQSHEKVLSDASKTQSLKMKDLWMELVNNRPLRVLSAFFIIAFTTMSVSNASESYFMTYNLKATPFMTSAFMWLGTIPAFVFLPLVPAMKRRLGKKGMFYLFIGISVAGMLLMYLTSSVEVLRGQFWLLCVIQFVKNAGILVATGYMWALVPEVVTFGELVSGRRVAGIVTALICIFMKAGMALGGVIPGLVLDWVGFRPGSSVQSELTLQGIVWLVTLIPSLLMMLGAFVISRYELTDKRMDEINREITGK